MFYEEDEPYTSGGFTADSHRDWHTQAVSEGVNSWACPWDCQEAPGADGEPGPELFATVWYQRPGLDRDGELTGYPVFSRDQARLFATVAAERSGRAVRVELARG
jgi:hypothetical protein